MHLLILVNQFSKLNYFQSLKLDIKMMNDVCMRRTCTEKYCRLGCDTM